MTPRPIAPAERKSVRLTVIFTEAEAARLERVAAFYALPKSVAAHDMVMRALDENPPSQIEDTALADAEQRAEDWRERMGL